MLQGIEALEGYIDPSTGGAVDDKESKTASDSTGVVGETTVLSHILWVLSIR